MNYLLNDLIIYCFIVLYNKFMYICLYTPLYICYIFLLNTSVCALKRKDVFWQVWAAECEEALGGGSEHKRFTPITNDEVSYASAPRGAWPLASANGDGKPLKMRPSSTCT